MANYKDLVAWQKAMDLVEHIYQTTQAFPDSEQFGLTNQVRRAAVSVPSNIAEGQGRGSKREFIRFIHMARGSLQEVETQLLIAERLQYIGYSKAAQLCRRCVELAKILNGLKRSLVPTNSNA